MRLHPQGTTNVCPAPLSRQHHGVLRNIVFIGYLHTSYSLYGLYKAFLFGPLNIGRKTTSFDAWQLKFDQQQQHCSHSKISWTLRCGAHQCTQTLSIRLIVSCSGASRVQQGRQQQWVHHRKMAVLSFHLHPAAKNPKTDLDPTTVTVTVTVTPPSFHLFLNHLPLSHNRIKKKDNFKVIYHLKAFVTCFYSARLMVHLFIKPTTKTLRLAALKLCEPVNTHTACINRKGVSY